LNDWKTADVFDLRGAAAIWEKGFRKNEEGFRASGCNERRASRDINADGRCERQPDARAAKPSRPKKFAGSGTGPRKIGDDTLSIFHSCCIHIVRKVLFIRYAGLGTS
jgi:hypothetical protein